MSLKYFILFIGLLSSLSLFSTEEAEEATVAHPPEQEEELVADRGHHDNERPSMYDRRVDRQLERDAVFPHHRCCQPQPEYNCYPSCDPQAYPQNPPPYLP